MCEMLDPQTKKPTDAQRAKPPKIGVTIIYKYQELLASGNPRFPKFVGERAD